ncbi:hypothetical protein SDC9_170149 [bioreactor metagenome]|uniref:Uncharacterized protein n=1 Tax=bioreactor metagenome TaxID=1076179 RepID=A0A645G812_9ZZZZ
MPDGELVFQILQLSHLLDHPALILDLVEVFDDLLLRCNNVMPAFIQLYLQQMNNLNQVIVQGNGKESFLFLVQQLFNPMNKRRDIIPLLVK